MQLSMVEFGQRLDNTIRNAQAKDLPDLIIAYFLLDRAQLLLIKLNALKEKEE